MSYITKNLVPGETLLFQTRHHWFVLLGPLLVSLLLGIPGVALLIEALAAKDGHGNVPALESSIGPSGMMLLGAVLLVIAVIIFAWGAAKRNATEMAVTNRRVLIKTGMASRRTLDLMLNKVESIGVTETFMGRMFGYGSVVIHGTGGTPESFVMIAHPQEFRHSVQEQIGAKRNWTDSDDLCVMFRATYKDEFYKALRNALHAEVDSWKNDGSSKTADTDLLWQQVFDLEPKMRNAEATTLARSVSDDTGTPQLVPLHALAAAGRHI